MSLFLAFVLALPAFVIPTSNAVAASPAPASTYNVEKECPQGKCVDKMINLVESKTRDARADKCLPPAGTKNEQAWFEDNPLTVDCFKQVKEIEEIYAKLEKIQAHFSGQMLDDEERMCREDKKSQQLNLQNLRDIESAATVAACTPARKQQIANKCGSDALCVLISSTTTFLGPLANKVIPKGLKAKGCNANQDNCFKQLALAFVKAVFGFFEGAWGLLKAAGRGIKNAGKKFWGWVTGAEKKSSTAQLAAAKASEEDGIWKQLMKDFPGTMAKIWGGLVASIKHWLANSIFCQEWSGTPQFSTCKRPAQGFDCTECKAMITGMCAMTGVIVSEVIPAFLTGGLVTVAKHGVSGAAKVAKLFKVSAATTKAIKKTKLASMVVKPVARVTTAIAKSRFSRSVLTSMQKAVKTIGKYMLRPGVKALKRTFTLMRAIAKTSKTYLMMTPAGPVITFGTKAARLAGKTILFPFENAMTLKSFQLGEKVFEKVFQKVGSAKLFGGIRPVLGAEAARAMGVIDDAYIEMQVTRVTKRHGSPFVNTAEDNYIKVLRQQRVQVIDEYLARKPNIPLDKLIDDLYPELNYGKFSKHLTSDDLIKAEQDLFESIGRMANGKEKDRLVAEMQKHMASMSRSDAMVGKPTFSRSEVISNATLSDQDRVAKAMEVAKVDPVQVTPAAMKKLELGVQEAHNIGEGGVFRYSFDEIKKKYRVLNEAGYSNKQAELLIRSGLAGKARPEDVYDALKNIPIPEVQPQLLDEMLSSDAFGPILRAASDDARASTARALQILEDGVSDSAEAAALFRQYEKQFAHVQKMAPPDSDAAALLAEFIRKKKQAGLTDDAIKAKIDEAFGACQ